MGERSLSTAAAQLQLALDDTTLSSARTVAASAADWVDVLEVGTILAVSEGIGAVRTLREEHPDHVIVADIRIARAGRALADVAFGAGADWVTVVSEAPLDTVRGAVGSAQTHGGEVQIELGHGWSDDDLRQWVDIGVSHAIVHRTHEADAPVPPWAPEDFEAIERIHDAGLKVTVTGGVTSDQLGAFDGLPVGVVIAGRAITSAPDIAAAAKGFRAAMGEIGWR